MKSFHQFILESYTPSQDDYEDIISRLLDLDVMTHELAIQELEFLYSEEDIKNILILIADNVNLPREMLLGEYQEGELRQVLPILSLISMNLIMNSGNQDQQISDEQYSAFIKENKITSLLNLRKFYGNLDISFSKIIDLGELTEIHGNFRLIYSEIKSLSNLQYVSGEMQINYTAITDFGNLRYIGGNFFSSNNQFENFGNIEEVGGTIYLSLSENIKSFTFTNLKKVYGLSVKNNLVKSLGSISEMNFLSLDTDGIEDLGNLEEINKLTIKKESKITSLGKLKKVNSYLHIDNENIKDLGELEEVGTLHITSLCTGLTSLGNLREINNSLIIKTDTITDPGKLTRFEQSYVIPDGLKDSILKLNSSLE